MKKNQGWHKQIVRQSIFLGRKNQYCENDYIPNAIYRFNAIPIKLPMAFFHRTRTKNFTIHMETEKTLNSQSSLEKEEWSWRNQPSWLQIILQSHSHQDSMALAQKQKYRPMEQDRKPRNKPITYGYLIFDKNIQWGKDKPLQCPGNTGQLHVNEWN